MHARGVMDDEQRAGFLRSQAPAYACLALANVRRAYPTHVTYVATGFGTPPAPRALHPAFYGSYDWHSCVAMHWSIVRLSVPMAQRQRRQRFSPIAHSVERYSIFGRARSPQ
jgi:hypothetical protein